MNTNEEKPMRTLFEAYLSTHSDSEVLSRAIDESNEELLIESVWVESELAFCAGFQTAVALLMGGTK